MSTHNQYQEYKGLTYSVSTLIDFAEDVKAETIDIRTLNQYYQVMEEKYDLQDFADKIKQVNEADLKYPILVYRGFVMDGKHRMIKALIQNKKTMKVKFLLELPPSID